MIMSQHIGNLSIKNTIKKNKMEIIELKNTVTNTNNLLG